MFLFSIYSCPNVTITVILQNNSNALMFLNGVFLFLLSMFLHFISIFRLRGSTFFYYVCLSVMHTEWLCKKCDSRDFSKIIEARETETNPINEKWYCSQEQARTKMKKLRWSREKKSEMKHGREIFFRISINWNEIRSNAVSLLLVLCGWKNLFILYCYFYINI